MRLHSHYQNVVSAASALPLSGEAEVGSAGEQPARNTLTAQRPGDWNGQGAQLSPSQNTDHSKSSMP